MPAEVALPSAAAQTEHPTLRAYLALLAGVLCIGFSAIFARYADAPGIVVAAWRVSTATLVLAIPFMRQPPARRLPRRASLGWALLGGALFAADVGLWNASLDYTTAANATFLANTAPVWVGLLTVLVLRRALPPRFWPSVLLALGGVGLLVFTRDGGTDLVARQGDLMAMVSSFFWAGYQMVTAHARAGMSTLSYLWLMVATSMVLIVPVAVLSGGALFGYELPTVLALLGAGLVSQTGGYIGINYALGHLSASRVSVVLLLQPVITTVAAFVLLGEAFGAWQMAGGLLILAGVYWLTSSRQEA